MSGSQVIIQLDKEQYRALQKLAEQDGCGSPGAYLKKQTLRLINGEAGKAGNGDQGQNNVQPSRELIAVLAEDFLRMHKNMQKLLDGTPRQIRTNVPQTQKDDLSALQESLFGQKTGGEYIHPLQESATDEPVERHEAIVLEPQSEVGVKGSIDWNPLPPDWSPEQKSIPAVSLKERAAYEEMSENFERRTEVHDKRAAQKDQRKKKR